MTLIWSYEPDRTWSYHAFAIVGWYLAAVCYSSGEGTAMASHITQGGYGEGVEVTTGLWANMANEGREHYVVLLRRKTAK